ncbi:hypothetical protein BC830DRAFT_1127816 [Chytriomyces sp. MP71]|nr:hypothetical protein BC830DRAFT_1127816 [Chytriomyces sp. MP71]
MTPIRRVILFLVGVNVILQLLRMLLTAPAVISPVSPHTQLGIQPLTSSIDRFPFANQETLPSNATIFRPVSRSEGFSIPELLQLCHNGHAMTITKHWAIESLEGQHEALGYKTDNFVNVCFPLEMATNQGCRSMGFCSDYVQYIAHAGGRLVDEFDKSVFHAKRVTCPNTTYLHGEWLIEPLFANVSRTDLADPGRVAYLTKRTLDALPDSLPVVRNLWLPNVEQITTQHLSVLPYFYKVLCKTKVTCTAIEAFFSVNKTIPWKPAQFISHSSPDVFEDAQNVFGEVQMDKLATATRSYNKFLHSYGKTGTKSTNRILECWLRHPNWPQLTLVGKSDVIVESLRRKAARSKNIQIFGFVDIPTLRALQIEHGVAICSSNHEGYGHYINDARTMGSLLMTTNHAPMNEFITGDGIDGILIEHDGKPTSAANQGLAHVFKSYAEVRTDDICAAVTRVLKLEEKEREHIGMAGRRSYDRATTLMVEKMAELLKEAWEHLGQHNESLHGAEYFH